MRFTISLIKASMRFRSNYSRCEVPTIHQLYTRLHQALQSSIVFPSPVLAVVVVMVVLVVVAMETVVAVAVAGQKITLTIIVCSAMMMKQN